MISVLDWFSFVPRLSGFSSSNCAEHLRSHSHLHWDAWC